MRVGDKKDVSVIEIMYRLSLYDCKDRRYFCETRKERNNMIPTLYELFRHWSDGGSVYILADMMITQGKRCGMSLRDEVRASLRTPQQVENEIPNVDKYTIRRDAN